MVKAKIYLTIAFAAVCFALVWIQEKVLTVGGNLLPGFLCVIGGYLFHLAFVDADPLASFLLAVGAFTLWGGALDCIAVRVRSEAFKRGADLIVDGIVKVMQEQKRP